LNKKKIVLAAALACSVALPAWAMDYEVSGFASLVAGRTYGSCTPENTLASDYSASCTRFVADWGHAGVYKDSWSIDPESKVGVQGTVHFSPQLSATGQVVGRLVNHAHADLEWAYVTWQPDPAWTIQAGRKRVPLFYYSDFQDVGYAYPWVRVPPDVYGWDVVNYNGANIAYSKAFGGWSMRTSVFGGTEASRNNEYSKIFYEEGKDVHWPHIVGADLELTHDWLTARVVYMRSGFKQVDRNSGEADVMPSGETQGRHEAYGGSINIDYNNFILRTESSVFDRSQYEYKATEWLVSAGYRIGKFTPLVTLSEYKESTRFPDAYDPAHWKTVAFTLRYELTGSSALKLQVDRIRDLGAPIAGSSTLLSASYDLVF
jgi:hypothetical protein